MGSQGIASGLDPFQSPIPTPSPPPSPETQIALDYIAAREGIPVDRLLVVNQHRREYDVLGKAFWYVKALDRKSRDFYTALVDLGDQTPAELQDVEKANSQTLEARYGKLEPELYEVLQTKGPDDEMTVAVWFTPVDHEAILAKLRANHPQASLELPERPWVAVQDRSLSAQIEAEYFQLLQEAHLTKQEDLARTLQAKGYTVRLHRGIPSLVAKLPKRVILEIAQRADVAMLYLIEGKLNLLLDKAIPTARDDVVWQRGIDGAAERIAIVEPGEVNLFHLQIDVKERRWAADEMDHTSRVASAAASVHPTYRGMAPGADIYSAGVNGQGDQWDDVDDAILWAYDRACRIMNASFTSSTGERSDTMQWIDRVFDYYAREYKITMTVAAGNQEQGNHIGSPAKGYNVLAVGGTDDKRTPSWSDDTMWPNSSWKNPRCGDGTYGDREKPEVVASAYDLTSLNNNGSASSNWNGTSYSAPQVAGLVALLAERNADLLDEPEAMRAIIMASAVHNIDGPSGIPTGQDLKDGAGAIDAALADSAASLGYDQTPQYPYPACEKSCWWSNYVYNNYPGNPGNFPPGTYRWYYFKATKGERIRIALAWVSDPAGPGGGYTTDPLHTDLDLAIFDPDGQGPVTNGYSASHDNSYEIVDFVAEKTGQYTIGVYKTAGTTEYVNWLGLAWVKDATYLPDVRGNYNGWNSVLRVRNDGAVGRNVTVTFFDRNGTPNARSAWLNHDQLWAFNVGSLIGSNFVGSAIVDGGEDVSVAVMNIHQSVPYATGSYTGLSEAGQTLYLPLLQRANNSMYADFVLFNVGTAQATVQVQYIPENGNYWGCTATNLTIPPNGSRNFNSRDGTLGCTTSSPFVGGARVTSNQPLVAVANQWRDVGADGSIEGLMSYEAFPTGGTVSHMPLLQYNNNGWYTSSNLQDTSGHAATATIRYYPEDGTGQCASVSRALAANDIEIVFPSPPYGSCTPQGKFVGTGYATRSYSFAAVVNQEEFATGNQKMCYGAVRGGSTAVVVPWVMKDKDGWQGRDHWYSGINVENVGSAITHVTVTYYDNNGNQVYTEPARQVSPLATTVYFPAPEAPGPATFAGSAVVTTDNGQPVAVVVNHFSTDGSDDTFMSYTGVNH